MGSYQGITSSTQTDSRCKEDGERGLEVSCDILRVLCLSCQHQLHHSSCCKKRRGYLDMFIQPRLKNFIIGSFNLNLIQLLIQLLFGLMVALDVPQWKVLWQNMALYI